MTLPVAPKQPYQLDALTTVANLCDSQSQGVAVHVIVHAEDNGRPRMALGRGISQLPPHPRVSPVTHPYRQPGCLCMMFHAILRGLTSRRLPCKEGGAAISTTFLRTTAVISLIIQ